MDMPAWKWDNIVMDFVVHLPWLVRGHDVIWVIVNQLTKRIHFFLMNLRMSIINWHNCTSTRWWECMDYPQV